jgi:hypothetical protein
MQSILAQAEYGGEILCGVARGAIAQTTSLATAITCAAALTLCAGLLSLRAQSVH